MRKLVLTQRTYRCKDCNPLSNVPTEEDKTYYKFFNEWGNRTVAWYEGEQYLIERDSYNGVVTLKGEGNMIKVKQGNVVDAVLNGECHFMLHISNAQRTMGSGVAKEVRARIPSAYTNYMLKPKNQPSISCSDEFNCFNLTAQQYYGYDGKRYLKYDWLIHCLRELEDLDFELQDRFETGNLRIAIPYKMGSALAGGDWDTVCEILEAFLGHHEIIAYKL